MNPATGLCEGCLRTLDEIAALEHAWTTTGKRAVWLRIDAAHRGGRTTP